MIDTKVISEVREKLENGVYRALQTYANVHRGSGHYSMITTGLYEEARQIVLRYLKLSKKQYVVIFCSPYGAELFTSQLKTGSYQVVSSQIHGLSIGVRAVAVKRSSLPGGLPVQAGGGTTKLIARDWVIWANPPDKFEAGTPAIVNVITFALALKLEEKYGKGIFDGNAEGEINTVENLLQDEFNKLSGDKLLEKLKESLIGRDVKVPTIEGGKPFASFDSSASTLTFEPVWNVFRQSLFLGERVASGITDQVKTICAGFLNLSLSDYDIRFTTNTTEALNIAASGLLRREKDGPEPVVLNTLLEHSSNDLPWRQIENSSLLRMDVDQEGFLSLAEMENILKEYNESEKHGNKRIQLVAVSGASNVLGSCNPIGKTAKLVHKYGAKLMVDAAQLIAHRSVDVDTDDIDILAFSAHKIYAPFGCGVLVSRKGILQLDNSIRENSLKMDYENTAGIAALGKSLIILQQIGMSLVREEEEALNMKMLRGLNQIPGLNLYGITDPESERFSDKLGVAVFEFKGKMPAKTAWRLAAEGGIGVRYGCHCAHLIIKHILNISPGMEKFQRIVQILIPGLKFQGLVRASLGIHSTEEDVDRLIKTLGKIAEPVKSKNANKKIKKEIKSFVDNRIRQVYEI